MTEPMSATVSANDRFERPSLLWYLAFDMGLGMAGVLALSKSAYEVVSTRAPIPSRKVVQAFWVGSGILHAAEAAYAYRLAKDAGMNRTAARWACETMVVGFPSILKLRSIAAEG